MSKYKIPFAKKTGQLLPFTSKYYGLQDPDIDWRDNYEFEDSLEYIEYIGGRSSMSMRVKSIKTGLEYNMFWTYFDSCIRRRDNTVGAIGPIFHGKWTFQKTGTNYSIRPV